jgi:NADPH:quinone reductase-like Zn-dependent oxidoreductase
VLITAVGSGVGLAAVQLAAAMGAVPFGTTRTESKLIRARDYGLRDGLAGGDDAALAAAVQRWTAGRGVECILDLVGGDSAAARLGLLAPQGTLIVVGLVAGRSSSVDLGLLLSRRLTMRGTVLRSRSSIEKAAVMQGFVRDVVPLIVAGRLRPVVDVVMPFSEIGAAHALVASDATFGKVVLTALP